MPRGGHRKGAGRRSPWTHVETVPIRVPKVLSEELIDIARRLDSGNAFDCEQNQIFSMEQQERLLDILSRWVEKRKLISRNTGKWYTAHKILDEVEPFIESVIDRNSPGQMSLLDNE